MLRVGTAATASSAIGFIGTTFPRRYMPSAVKSAFASASANATDCRAEPGEQRQKDAADLDDGQHRDDDFRRHRHEHADRIAFAQAELRRAWPAV